jgi:SAM-dependent methyltransferase
VSFLYFLTSWLDRLFDIRGHQKLSLILEFGGNVLSLGGLTLALLWQPEKTVLAVAVYATAQVLYSSIWLVFAYHVAEFNARALTVLLRDAVVSLGLATALIGGAHMFFHGWIAFFVSAAAALGLTGFAFVRYVSTGRAFTSSAERFRRFWADKNTTLNSREGDEFWRAQAGELKNLYSAKPPSRVLEIGCGDGSLFPYFEIPPANYKGVDFTPQFIERFRSKEPAVRLECAEGASYFDGGTKYDLILLNGIVQHFDSKMLEQHLQNARAMMQVGGILIWGSIPQRRYRRYYDAGKWSGSGKMSAYRFLRSWGGRLLGLDAMGYWYEPGEVSALAMKYGLQVQFFPSDLYPYRFHAVIRETQPNRERQTKKVEERAEMQPMEKLGGSPYSKLSSY